MVNAHHQRLPTQRRVGQVHIPQGALVVERRRGEIGHQLLQLQLARFTRQDHSLEVLIEIEIGIMAPVVGAPLQHGPLVETGLHRNGVAQSGPQTRFIKLSFKHQDTDDLHQVVGSVHA